MPKIDAAILEHNVPDISDCVAGYEQISVITVFARRGLQSVGFDGIPLVQRKDSFRLDSRDAATHAG